MGITAKIWPATEDEVLACLKDPSHTDSMFQRCDTLSADQAIARSHALIHSARELESCLARLATPSSGLRRIEDVSDPTYVMSPARVRSIDERQTGDPFQALLGFPTEAINEVEIADLVRLAASTSRGLMFCFFEDW